MRAVCRRGGLMRADLPKTSSATAPTDRPAFELECLFDDLEAPTEVTVFYPRGERTVTEWITADVETAVPLGDAR